MSNIGEMFKLKNVEVRYARLETPDTKFEEGGVWKIQAVTYDSNVAKSWKEALKKLSEELYDNTKKKYGVPEVKHQEAVDGDAETGEPPRRECWFLQLQRRATRPDATENTKVKVYKVSNGKLVEDSEARKTLGNGSICDINAWASTYEYKKKEGVKLTLQEILVKKHIVFEFKQRDPGFDIEQDSETIEPSDDDDVAF